MRLFSLALAALLSGLSVGQALAAESYPSRPIKFIVSYPPGGPADILARLVAHRLGEALGQQVVIDNRGGANGNIGASQAAASPPDGYTIFMMTSSHGANMALYSKPGYDVMKDFAHITNIASYPLLLVTHPTVPVKSVKELIALAKAKPGQLSFASAGSGGGAHLAAELFRSMAGIDMLHVPYKGTGPALMDVVGGQVSLMFAGVSAALPHVKVGRLNVLGVSSAKRLPFIPDIPTVAEAGVPGYEIASWLGVSAPAGTPKPIIDRLNREVTKLVGTPEFQARLVQDGAESRVTDPATFTSFIAQDIRMWAEIIKISGAKAE